MKKNEMEHQASRTKTQKPNRPKQMYFYSICFGFAFGWLSSVLFETLMDLVGAQRFSSAVGLVTIVECGPVLLGPPLLGESISSLPLV